MSSAAASKLAKFAETMQTRYKPERITNGLPPVIIPSGSVSTDWALRCGGFQEGRLYEIVGPKDSGKSSLAIAAMVQFLRFYPDRGVSYVNMENTFDPRRATQMGLDCSDAAIKAGRWMPMLPENSEHVSDMARAVVASDVMSLVVVDSIGAMESAKTLGKDADAAAVAVGRNAKIITQMCKALSTDARLHRCTVILINQPRANIGGMGGDISAGPKLLEHSTTVKIQMRAKFGEDDVRKLKLPGEDEPDVVSHKVVAKVARMKNGMPGRAAEFFMNRVATPAYGPPGVDQVDEYVTIGIKAGAITQKGAWYVLPDGTQKQGRIRFTTFLRNNPKYLDGIREAIVFDAPTDEYGVVPDDGSEIETAAPEPVST